MFRFDFLMTYEYTFNKKGKTNMNISDTDIISQPLKTNSDKNGIAFIKKIEEFNFNLSNKKEKKIKKNTASIWISDDFPLKFSVFFQIIYYFLKK